jgi:hypothetical protein
MMKTLFNRNTLRSLPKQDLLALKCSLEYAKRNLRFEFPPHTPKNKGHY